jgi:hypothetical protein
MRKSLSPGIPPVIIRAGYQRRRRFATGGQRLVYGVDLAENTHAYLLGQDKRPRYVLPLRSPAATTARIVRWWASRWLLGRIERDEVLDRVRSHNFVLPVRHGARVQLPPADPEDGITAQYAPPRSRQ